MKCDTRLLGLAMLRTARHSGLQWGTERPVGHGHDAPIAQAGEQIDSSTQDGGSPASTGCD